MPPAMTMDLFGIAELLHNLSLRREGFVGQAVTHCQTTGFTRRQVAEWWELIGTVTDDSVATDYAEDMGYTPGQMARALAQFGLAHAYDSGTHGTLLVSRPPRLTPIHAHVHRLAHRDGWWCAYCGVELACACDTSLDLPVAVSDHVIPQSRGGCNEDTNRVLACVPCNSSKRDMTPDEWGRPLWGWCS